VLQQLLLFLYKIVSFDHFLADEVPSSLSTPV
jgi:hypothetical protein